jgi:hypothetical protein
MFSEGGKGYVYCFKPHYYSFIKKEKLKKAKNSQYANHIIFRLAKYSYIIKTKNCDFI